ncbi:DUF222 domain-containing protein [Kribbella hippodromi]
MSEDELVRALDQADADLARLQTHRLRLIAALDKTGHAEKIGARDTVQYIEYRYRLDHYRARRDVQLARALPKYTAITAALPTDPSAEVILRPAQAEAIVLELEKTPRTVPVDDLDCAERELARLTHLSPLDLRKAAVLARDILDTDGPEPEEHKAYARESLTLTPADRGVKFRGYLANENAELLRSLITTGARPHKTPDGARDPRSREKRQADALTTTLTLAATTLDTTTPVPPTTAATASGTADGRTGETTCGTAGGTAGGATGGATGGAAGAGAGSTASATGAARAELVPGFGAKANITVTIDLADLKSATANAIGHPVYGDPLSAATIRRLACDANIIPIVLGSNSEPLDVGRQVRLVTKAMRRALNTRDRGCVICAAPPVMCDAHHIKPWLEGGPTALTNLALLCRPHHTALHAGHWHLTPTNTKPQVTRPPWTTPTHTTPAPDTSTPTSRPAPATPAPAASTPTPATPVPATSTRETSTPTFTPAPATPMPAAPERRTPDPVAEQLPAAPRTPEHLAPKRASTPTPSTRASSPAPSTPDHRTPEPATEQLPADPRTPEPRTSRGAATTPGTPLSRTSRSATPTPGTPVHRKSEPVTERPPADRPAPERPAAMRSTTTHQPPANPSSDALDRPRAVRADYHDEPAIRAATYRAIWGEDPPHNHPHTPPKAPPTTPPPDPWANATAPNANERPPQPNTPFAVPVMADLPHLLTVVPRGPTATRADR